MQQYNDSETLLPAICRSHPPLFITLSHYLPPRLCLFLSLSEEREEAEVWERGSGDALLSFGLETDVSEEQRNKETHLKDILFYF